MTKQLERHFAAYVQSQRPPNLWQRFIATLTFDSHVDLALGTRTAAASENQRQLIYETDFGTVICTLQRRGHDHQFDLLGQFLPTKSIAEDHLARVLLLREEEEFDTTLMDDLGEFTLTALPPGSYTLILSTHEYEITVSPLNLSL